MYTAGAPSGDAHVSVDTDKIVGGSKLLGEIRDHMRRRSYSIRTEQAYLDWAKRYILFNGKRHPNELGVAQIAAFLNLHAVECNVAASTQNQAPLRIRTQIPQRVETVGLAIPVSGPIQGAGPALGQDAASPPW
jgi:hypothetical protein